MKKGFFVVLITILTVGILLAADVFARRVPYDGTGFVLTEEELQEGIWLLQLPDNPHTKPSDSYQTRLTVPEDMQIYLRLQDANMEFLHINDQEIVPQNVLRHTIVMLPEGVTEYVIEVMPAQEKVLRMIRNNIYVGTLENILNSEVNARWQGGMFFGFFCFSALFAIILFIWKRSEKYLLFYVFHALIVLTLNMQNILAKTDIPMIVWLRDVWQAVSSVRGADCILQNAYILMTAWIHAQLYRAFVDDRIGGHSYMRYLEVIFGIVTMSAVLLGSRLDGLVISYFFYLCMYICEGYILLHNSPVSDQKRFQYVLLAAWCTSFLFWLLRTANNLGIMNYPYHVSIYIAACYTIGFLICISGRFSLKFAQAEALQQSTAEMNEHLENLVEQRTLDLKESYEKLNRMQQTKNQFVSNIIHNLKTPLFSVQGYLELVQDSSEQNIEEALKYYQVIRRNIEYIQGMIQQLSLYNRLEDQRIVFHKVLFDWNHMLQKSLYGLEMQLKEKNVSIEIKGDVSPKRCDGDESYLRQAIQCILDNAIRHSRAGGHIEIYSYIECQEIVTKIQDFGEGMDEEICSHIFERGYSYHTNGEKSSGLGLNIVKIIMEAHQGRIEVESKTGEGSTFTLYIPAQNVVPEANTI